MTEGFIQRLVQASKGNADVEARIKEIADKAGWSVRQTLIRVLMLGLEATNEKH